MIRKPVSELSVLCRYVTCRRFVRGRRSPFTGKATPSFSEGTDRDRKLLEIGKDRIRPGFLPGMTLVEVLVSIFILTIGMGGFAMLFLRSWQTNRFILETGIASATASRAVTHTVADLRKIRQGDDGSYPIVSGGANSLTVFLDIDDDGKTERVHYYLQNGLFKQGVTKPSSGLPATYPSGDQAVTTITSYVANTSSDPVFSYYNDNYPGDTVNNPLTTPVSIQIPRLVKIRLIININPNRAPETTTIESTVAFRNLN